MQVHGDDVASMAWGARDLISTQVRRADGRPQAPPPLVEARRLRGRLRGDVRDGLRRPPRRRPRRRHVLLFDNTLGWANALSITKGGDPSQHDTVKQFGMTANLSVNYRRPLFVGQTVVISCSLDRVEGAQGRKRFLKGVMKDGKTGGVIADATALYVAPRTAAERGGRQVDVGEVSNCLLRYVARRRRKKARRDGARY